LIPKTEIYDGHNLIDKPFRKAGKWFKIPEDALWIKEATISDT